ncbi:MAG: ComEC/Rec2 family competence protein [Treponema sp.]|nr:ComEC/Rec2 family competence protein [Treponema sp.]
MTHRPIGPLRDCALVFAACLYLAPPGRAPAVLPVAALALWALARASDPNTFREAGRDPGPGRTDPRRRGIRSLPRRLRAAAAALALAFLARRGALEAGSPAALGLPAGSVEWVQGTAAEDSAPLRSGGRRLVLDLEAAGAGPGIRVSANGRLPVIVDRAGAAIPTGARIRIRGRPVQDRGGAGWVLFARGRDVEALGFRTGRAELRARLRSDLRSALARAGGEGAALLEALVLGVRDDLDLDLAEAFRKAGCSHILALSGQHLGILAALVSFLAAPLLGRRGALAAAMLLACAFTAFIGPKPSLVRAAVMFAYAGAARLAGRPQDAGNGLAAAFLLQCMVWPGVERELSFQLSYAALAGLVLLSPAFEYLLLPRVPPVPAKALAASLAAQAVAGPRVLLAFGALYPGGILAAALAAPFTAAFIWAGLLGAGVCSALPFLEPAAREVLNLLYRVLRLTMETFARFPGPAVPEGAGRWAGACVVAAAGLAVYAVPYVDHYRTRRRVPAELRFPPGPGGLPGSPGPGDAQTLRPELPGEPRRAPPHRGPGRGGERIPRLGNRSRLGSHDLRAPRPGSPGGSLRDRPRILRRPPGDLRRAGGVPPAGRRLPPYPGFGLGGGEAGPDPGEPAV